MFFLLYNVVGYGDDNLPAITVNGNGCIQRSSLYIPTHLFSYVFWSYGILKKKSLCLSVQCEKEWFVQQFLDQQAHPWHSWALDQGGTKEWEPSVDVPRCPRRWCKVPLAIYCQQQLPPITSIFRHLSFFPLEATSSCQRGVLQMGLGGSHSYKDVIPAIKKHQ